VQAVRTTVKKMSDTIAGWKTESETWEAQRHDAGIAVARDSPPNARSRVLKKSVANLNNSCIRLTLKTNKLQFIAGVVQFRDRSQDFADSSISSLIVQT
jgi:hypothetical protein